MEGIFEWLERPPKAPPSPTGPLRTQPLRGTPLLLGSREHFMFAKKTKHESEWVPLFFMPH